MPPEQGRGSPGAALIPSNPQAGVLKPQATRAADAVALASAGLLLLVFLAVHGPELARSGSHAAIAAGITLAFAVIARISRGVDTSGAVAGAVIALVLASRDLRSFWVLLVVFVITLTATRWNKAQKRRLRLAEAEAGRSASQVMANLGVAALALAVPVFPGAMLLALSALAEVAADTTSSEIGTAFPGRTVLITTWKAVASGVDGGISLAGTLAGALASGIVAGSSAALGLVSLRGLIVVALAGSLGMLIDSLLGATVEQRYLNNDLVNLLSTTVAAAAGWSLR